MSNSRDGVVRRPRHSAAKENSSCVWLEVPADDGLQQHDVDLIDFSRTGAKFELDQALRPKQDVVLRIRLKDRALEIRLPATVQWQRVYEPGRWYTGCLFCHEVSYEIVGELFLHGILSTDAQ